MSSTSRGFTVIELIVVALLFSFASVIFFVQKASVESSARDEQRKTSINALYYGLEEVFYKENSYYPRTIGKDTLRSVDPASLKDTAGIQIGESASQYRYTPINCEGDKCQAYELRTTLENEADFIKTQRTRN